MTLDLKLMSIFDSTSLIRENTEEEIHWYHNSPLVSHLLMQAHGQVHRNSRFFELARILGKNSALFRTWYLSTFRENVYGYMLWIIYSCDWDNFFSPCRLLLAHEGDVFKLHTILNALLLGSTRCAAGRRWRALGCYLDWKRCPGQCFYSQLLVFLQNASVAPPRWYLDGRVIFWLWLYGSAGGGC